VRVGADEHGGVADRLDQAHVAAQALGGELDQAVGDAPELVGRDLLAQRVKPTRSAKQTVTSRAPGSAPAWRSAALMASVRTDWRRCRRAMYSSIGPIIGMKPATRSA
jgi:hypothetical protein